MGQRHDGKAVPIRIERQNPRLVVQDERMHPRHPTHAAEVFVFGILEPPIRVGLPAFLAIGRNIFQGCLVGPLHSSKEFCAWFEEDQAALVPDGRPRFEIVPGELVATQGGMPFVARIVCQISQRRFCGSTKRQGLVSGKPGSSASKEWLTPTFFAFAFARPLDDHIVGAALSRAVIPTSQQVAIGTFDDARGVIVLVVRGKK